MVRGKFERKDFERFQGDWIGTNLGKLVSPRVLKKVRKMIFFRSSFPKMITGKLPCRMEPNRLRVEC
jgi:hypothetical protein